MSDSSAVPPSFEDRLAELTEITAALEQGALGLDESLARFERGVGLLRECREMLDNVERRVEVLTGFDAEGQPVTRPFDASATFEAPAAARPKGAAAGTGEEAKPARRRGPRKGVADETPPFDTGEETGKEPGPRLF